MIKRTCATCDFKDEESDTCLYNDTFEMYTDNECHHYSNIDNPWDKVKRDGSKILVSKEFVDGGE